MRFGRRGCRGCAAVEVGGQLARWSVRSEDAGRSLHEHRWRRRALSAQAASLARTQWGRIAQATDARGVIGGSRESRERTADGGCLGVLTPWSGEATRVDGRMAGSRGAAIPRESGQDKHRRVSPAPGQGYASGGGGVVVDVVGGFCCCGEQQPKFKWGFFVRLRAGERESSPINEPREGGERRGQTRQSVGNGRGVFCRLACKSRNY